MGVVDEALRMKQEGKSDDQISMLLAARGYRQSDINGALSQMQIKDAVNSGGGVNPATGSDSVTRSSYNSQEMVPSMLGSSADPVEVGVPSPNAGYDENGVLQGFSEQQPQPPQYPSDGSQAGGQQSYAPDYGQGYATEYSSYSSAVGADTINEIADQIVSEKMVQIRDKLEEVLTFKNLMESKVDYLDERLKRIEKIIDRLQLSVLQKVGDYAAGVEDVKRELSETQKSFKALLSQQGKIQKPGQ